MGSCSNLVTLQVPKQFEAVDKVPARKIVFQQPRSLSLTRANARQVPGRLPSRREDCMFPSCRLTHPPFALRFRLKLFVAWRLLCGRPENCSPSTIFPLQIWGRGTNCRQTARPCSGCDGAARKFASSNPGLFRTDAEIHRRSPHGNRRRGI